MESTVDEGVAAMRALTDHLLALVEHKRRHPSGDLLGGLTSDGAFTDEEVAGVGVLLLTAGHETVASTLGLGTFALLCHPDQMELVRAGIPTMEAVVEELLRYLPVFHHGVPRTTLEDVDLGGSLMRAGETVTVSLPDANRDPERFDDPAGLDVVRDTRGHLAFGHGVHQCIGQHLARIEMRAGFTGLVRRFPRLRLAVAPQDVALSGQAGLFGLHRLPVTW
jgi:cytochrome P450